MWSVDDYVIRNDKDETGTSVRQALEDAAAHCANADKAEPLFRDVLARLEATRDELQTQYPNAPLDDKQRALRSYVDEVVKFAGLLQQYCSMSFADRVLQHKKIAKRLREIHAGAPNVYNYLEGGLDNATILLRNDKRPSTAWREPFDAAAAAFEAAVAETVNDDATVSLYRQDSLLALEAATLLCNAQKNGDRLQWQANPAAQHLRDKIKDIADSDDVQLPEWFVPESDINYKSRRFAKGSFGAVHYGTWGSGTKVVVKVLLDEDRDKRLSAKLRQKFIEEADLWSKISHPYVLKLYGACHVTAPPFFVCEDATKGDLSAFLKKDKSRLWRFLFQSALAIEYLHGKKIIHGDLKLNNILVGADGYARVADFGLSRFKKPTGNGTLTRHDSVLDGAGALRWRAPEALLHKAQYESDVYSFALCMIEALSGEIPYANLNEDDEVIANIQNGVLPARPADMSDEIWMLVQKMTVSEPSERATIKQVIVVLKKLANAELDKESENMSLCEICSSIMTDGSNFCRKCRRNVMTKPMSKEVGPILSKEDLPRVIELVTLSNGQHEHKAPSALRDYMFGQPDHQKYVHDAGGIPVLAKVLDDDELESLVRLEALTGLGCTMVANKKIQNTAKFENVVEMLKFQLHNGDERVKTKAVLVLGYMAHGNPENRKELVADTAMLERIREYAKGPEDDDLPMAATRALLFLEPQASPATAG